MSGTPSLPSDEPMRNERKRPVPEDDDGENVHNLVETEKSDNKRL